MLLKGCTQYARKFENSSGQRTGKGVFISVPKKGNDKECSNYCTIVFISHDNKDMLKIIKARLQYLSNVQARFRKGRGIRDQIATSVGSQNKQRNSRKTSTSTSVTM